MLKQVTAPKEPLSNVNSSIEKCCEILYVETAAKQAHSLVHDVKPP
jgi:hypothetical protein